MQNFCRFPIIRKLQFGPGTLLQTSNLSYVKLTRAISYRTIHSVICLGASLTAFGAILKYGCYYPVSSVWAVPWAQNTPTKIVYEILYLVAKYVLYCQENLGELMSKIGDGETEKLC